ncbi:hypothetical protein [Demequina salsinemoris]|uniref:hypothetical protein n=1 Tax=Demequina salsinemoris TaxID=577470 RepID=UPI000A7E5135|nr:hypothetical protein [Demequina salsinemoris]
MPQLLLADLVAEEEPIGWRGAALVGLDFSRISQSLGSPMLAAQAISALIDRHADSADLAVAHNAMLLAGPQADLSGSTSFAMDCGIPNGAIAVVVPADKPKACSEGFWAWTVLVAARLLLSQEPGPASSDQVLGSASLSELLTAAAKTPPVSYSRSRPPFRNRPAWPAAQLDTEVVSVDFVGYTSARQIGDTAVGRDLLGELKSSIRKDVRPNPVDVLGEVFETRVAQQSELDAVMDRLARIAEEHSGTALRLAADGGFGNDGPTVVLPSSNATGFLGAARAYLDVVGMPFVSASGRPVCDATLADLEARLRSAKLRFDG